MQQNKVTRNLKDEQLAMRLKLAEPFARRAMLAIASGNRDEAICSIDAGLAAQDEEPPSQFLKTALLDIGVSERSLNFINQYYDIETIEDFLKFPLSVYRDVPHVGESTLLDLIEAVLRGVCIRCTELEKKK